MPPSEEEGRWRLLNPLAIRFSQPRVAPHFRDGHLLTETIEEVEEAPLEDADLAQRRRPRKDAAEGVPPYDVVLVPPFPAIRVISWLPKIRNEDGQAERDANGDQILGRRAWFALDNRRLQVVQEAAARRYPHRCCVSVRCIEEVPGGSTMKEIRKFRTTTEGRSVDVGVRTGDTQLWSWFMSVPQAITVKEDFEPEGHFPEDLWCAEQWATRAFLAGGGGRGSTAAADAWSSSPTADADADGYGAANGHGGHGAANGCGAADGCGYAPASQGYAPAYQGQGPANVSESRPALAPAGNAPCAGRSRGGMIAPCPLVGWEYIDPSGKVQGPFGLEKMRLWYQHNYFLTDLPMRCDVGDAFVPFLHLFPDIEPFTGDVMRYAQ